MNNTVSDFSKTDCVKFLERGEYRAGTVTRIGKKYVYVLVDGQERQFYPFALQHLRGVDEPRQDQDHPERSEALENEDVGRRLSRGRLEDLVSAILEDEKTSSKTTWTFSPTMALIELRDWTRLTEVQNYARFHDIAVPEAIERLVNSGLSHEHRGWTS